MFFSILPQRLAAAENDPNCCTISVEWGKREQKKRRGKSKGEREREREKSDSVSTKTVISLKRKPFPVAPDLRHEKERK